jgi:hypothetical protein
MSEACSPCSAMLTSRRPWSTRRRERHFGQFVRRSMFMWITAARDAMKIRTGLLVALLVLTCSNVSAVGPTQPAEDISGWPDHLPDCAAPPGWTKVQISDGLPVALKKIFEGTVLRGDRSFCGGDGCTPSRFLFAWRRGGRWLIATEFGGIFYNQSFEMYQVNSDGESASEITPSQIALGTSLCEAALKAAVP